MLELTGDLQVKQRELKILKFKSVFESPVHEKRDAVGGSFVAAASARAAYLGRSITKTSEELKNTSLLEGDDRKAKHGRIGSHFSSSVLEGDLDAAVPRRKTVGFKDASQRSRLSISQKGDFDDSKKTENIAIDDVESSKSPDVFDRASDDGNVTKEQLDADAAVDPSPEQKVTETKEPLFHPKQ